MAVDPDDVQQMVEAIHELRKRQVQLEQELDATRAAATAAQGAAAQGSGGQPQPGPAARTGVDTRLLGKPQEFHGEHERWRDWSAVFRGYAGAVNEGLATLMPWAVARTAVVVNASLSTDQARDSRQLYWMLLMLLKQGPPHILP